LVYNGGVVAPTRRDAAMLDERKPMLLVVTDDFRRLSRLDDLLVRKGYLVTTCSTPADAEKAVAGKKVDLIILSKMGDVGDENALLWKVKNLCPQARAILLDDHPDWASSVAPLDSGADDLLTAPYSDDELLECVKNVLAGGASSA
jgi:DNA-binding response OmpR family regulator